MATALAEGSRNRRAGELVGAGLPAGAVEAAIDQTAESLATVPLLGLAFEREGIDAPVTTGLRTRARRGRLGRPVAREHPRERRRPRETSRLRGGRRRVGSA